MGLQTPESPYNLEFILDPRVFEIVKKEGGVNMIYYIYVDRAEIYRPLTHELYLHRNWPLMKLYDKMSIMCGGGDERVEIMASDELDFILERYISGFKLLMHYNRSKGILVGLVYR